METIISYYWLGLIAASAALAQGWMLYKARSHITLSSAFTILSVTLIFQHSLEFIVSLFLVYNPSAIAPYMHVFMASMYIMGMAMMNVCRTVAKSQLADFSFKVLVLMTVGIVFLHSNGLLFGDFQLTKYSVISSPGKYQGIWHMYAAILMTTITGTLLGGVFSEDKEIKRRSWVSVKALSPIIVCVVGVVFLQLLGIQASTAIVLPIASAIMLAILMLEEKNELVVFEENIKDQWARFVIKLRIGSYVLFNWHGTDRKDLLLNIDLILVNGAMKRKKTTIDAAGFLKIPRNTLNNLRQKEASQSQGSSTPG